MQSPMTHVGDRHMRVFIKDFFYGLYSSCIANAHKMTLQFVGQLKRGNGSDEIHALSLHTIT